MRLPAFVAEMKRDEHVAKIRLGVATGYLTVAMFAAIAVGAQHAGLLPASPWVFALVGAKLVTNTLQWAAVRAERAILPTAGLNLLADLVVINGAVHFTGGLVSPLVPLFLVEVSVIALLTNVGLTIATVVCSVVLFSGTVVLTHAGVLQQHPTPLEAAGGLTTAYVVVHLALFAAVVIAPGAYVASIVQRLRQRELALEARTRELVEASRAKAQFMAGVTHELRTPLHGILGVTELVCDGIYGPVTDRQREGMAAIEDSARGQLELVDSLLALARADAARLEVHVAPVDLAELLETVATSGHFLLGRKRLDVTWHTDRETPTLQTDRAKLTQILVNLLSNAIKFTPEGGGVHLDARPDPAGDGARIVVRDTGIGIPPHELGRIFEPFHQVDASAAREYGGAGVGLAVVARLVELLGGRVTVDSREGEGTTFALTLPRETVVSPSKRPPPRISRPPPA